MGYGPVNSFAAKVEVGLESLCFGPPVVPIHKGRINAVEIASLTRGTLLLSIECGEALGDRGSSPFGSCLLEPNNMGAALCRPDGGKSAGASRSYDDHDVLLGYIERARIGRVGRGDNLIASRFCRRCARTALGGRAADES